MPENGNRIPSPTRRGISTRRPSSMASPARQPPYRGRADLKALYIDLAALDSPCVRAGRLRSAVDASASRWPTAGARQISRRLPTGW